MQMFALGVAAGVAMIIPLVYLTTRRTGSIIRRAEARRRSSERLAEIARLTSGLAHEIKNPLSTVNLNVQLLEEDLRDIARHVEDEDDPLAVSVGRLERRFKSLSRETDHLRDILEDFLRFAGRIKLERIPVNVTEMVDEMIDFFAPQADAARVHLRNVNTGQPVIAEVDAGLVKQALLNLLINAVQAMESARQTDQPHGGCDELIIRIQQQRDTVTIHIIDTGPGIPPEAAESIFEPYYSTKKGGTGLGLPTSRRIIEEHGGTLSFHTEPARGTDFTITLPLKPPTEVKTQMNTDKHR